MTSWVEVITSAKTDGILDTIMVAATLVVAIFTYRAAKAASASAATAERGLREQGEATALSNLLNLSARFDSPLYRQPRSFAANMLLAQRPDDKSIHVAQNPLPGTMSGSVNLDTVLGFFELLGFLYKRDASLDEPMWSLFGHWVSGYYQAAESFIQEQRKIDPTYYCDLVDLAKALNKVQEKKNPGSQEQWSSERLSDFLKEERALYVPT
jgi:hypothetical protein